MRRGEERRERSAISSLLKEQGKITSGSAIAFRNKVVGEGSFKGEIGDWPKFQWRRCVFEVKEA